MTTIDEAPAPQVALELATTTRELIQISRIAREQEKRIADLEDQLSRERAGNVDAWGRFQSLLLAFGRIVHGEGDPLEIAREAYAKATGTATP